MRPLRDMRVRLLRSQGLVVLTMVANAASPCRDAVVAGARGRRAVRGPARDVDPAIAGTCSRCTSIEARRRIDLHANRIESAENLARAIAEDPTAYRKASSSACPRPDTSG